MIGIIISFLAAVLAIYALYNALGYYDPNALSKNKKIKDINNLFKENDNQEYEENPSNEKLFQNDEIETNLIRKLDQESQEALTKINLNIENSINHLYLSSFKNISIEIYTKLLKSLHNNLLDEVKNIINSDTFEKLKLINEESRKNLNLVKINDFHINKISFENPFVTISVLIESEEMIEVEKKHFTTKNFKRNLIYGIETSKISENLWLILELKSDDLF